MSQSPANRDLSAGIEREFGLKYCRSCNTDRPAAGGQSRKGRPWKCSACVAATAKVAARRNATQR